MDQIELTIKELPLGRFIPSRQSIRWDELTYYQKVRDKTHQTSDPRKVSNHTRANIFSHLYTLYNGKCHWCGIDVTLEDHSKTRGTIDHLVTMNMGRRTYYHGGHVLSCNHCNSQRNLQELKNQKKPKLLRLIFTDQTL
jgi:hypothetical protein